MADTPFPVCIVEVLAEFLENVPGVDTVMQRPLWPTDPHASVGVSAADWSPVDMQIGQYDPAIAAYSVTIETLVNVSNEVEGRNMTAEMAKSIRTMLYRDANLRVRLAQTQEVANGVREHVSHWKIRAQRFASNKVRSSFLYVSTTDLIVETETG